MSCNVNTAAPPNRDNIRLGAIAFINTLPVYFDLHVEGVTLHYDHPAALNQLMTNRQLDVSPVSSAHYLQNKNDYVLLDDLSVSSPGAVESVLFISKKPLEHALDHNRIAVPDDSATSVQLLRWILTNATGEDPQNRFEVYPAGDVQKVLADFECALVIGDNALLIHENGLPEGYHCYDLSSLWKERTGLPFVFAVWVANKQWAEQFPTQLTAVNRALTTSRDRFLESDELMERGLAEAATRCDIPKDSIRRYYTQCLTYTLSADHKKSLALFEDILSLATNDVLAPLA